MTRYTAIPGLCLTLALAAPTLAAQHSRRAHADDESTSQAASRNEDGDGMTIDTTISFATTGGVVDLSLISGHITVTGWSRGEARIHVSSDDAMPVHFEHSADRILLDARRTGRWHGEENDVEYDLTVPVGTRVLMHSMSGDLHARGTQGEIEARSVSGDLEVDGGKHGATLESVSGNVRARDMAGDLRARSVSGDVDLDAVTGDVTLSSVSGHGYVSAARSRVVRMETVSGDLSYAGTVDATGTYDFRGHSANIRLEMPSDVGATLSIDTFSGDIETDFPMTIQPNGDRGPSRHHVETTLGHGGAHVTISTFSGDIELRRSGHHTNSE